MISTKYNLKKLTAELIYLFLIFFFCYTAANKLMNIESFRTNLIKTTLFSIKTAYYFSFIVILLEIIIIGLLIYKKLIGLLVFVITLIFFTLYISYLNYNQLYEVCGCGGVLNGLKYQYHFMINIGLIFGGMFCLYANKYEK